MRSLTMTLALALSTIACASAPRPMPEVETVGQLAASDSHVMTAAVHASTDLARGSFVASDDDAPVAAVAGEVVEAPDVAAKNGHGF